MELTEWGKCDKDQLKEFEQSLERFSKELVEAMKSLTSGIELKRPDAKYDLNRD